MYTLRLPALGQTMERGLIQSWLLKEGDSFAAGDPLYEVESDKATVVVEATRPGTLRRIVAESGDEVEVGAFVAIVAEDAQVLSDAEVDRVILEERELLAAMKPPPGAQLRVAAGRPDAGSERAKPRGPRATPRARALAERLGIDLATVEVMDSRKSLTADDVERAAAIADGGGPAVRERRPLKGISRAMAEVVTRSWSEVPQFVQQVWIDATALVATRARERAAIEEQYGLSLSYTDLLLKGLVDAVREAPEVNARFAGDEIVLYEDVNVSVAVSTDAGLVVPVVHKAQLLELGELARTLRELAARAREARLTPRDLSGGTITLSNLGAHGVDTGVPLVTAPQAAIVFAGTIAERPHVVDGRLEVRPTLGLAIGFDHRVVDGVQAARFTTALKRLTEDTSPSAGIA